MGKKLLFVFPLLSFLSCKETVTEIKTETVTENIFICCLQSESSSAELIASPIQSPGTSNVTLKWGDNNRIFPFKTIELGKTVFKDTTKLNSSIAYTVQFISPTENASGTITMPDSTSIIIPELEDTIPLGDSISVKWGRISGANFYEIGYQAWARNSAGNEISELPYKYAFVSDTSFTIPASYFNDSSAIWDSVSINVATYAGPSVQPNSAPNMSGSVKGFLYACGKATNIDCYYGTPKYKGKAKTTRLHRFSPDKIVAIRKIIGVFENTRKK